MRRLFVQTIGSGPRVVLVHGSVAGGMATWAAQRELSHRYTLEVVVRPGFPPNEPVDEASFEWDAPLVAEQLGGGAHLVGHSYGGVVSLLAAALRPEAVRSLTVIEPPCMKIAAGNPAVDEFVAGGTRWWETGPRDPEAFLRGFLRSVGSDYDPPSPPPAAILQGARTLLVERHPWEAEIALDALAVAPFPKLVVSGAHGEPFDATCDVLEERLGAERAVVPGAGHSCQRAPGFNAVLADFLERADAT